MNYKQYWLFSSLLGLCLNTNAVYGQIVDDGTSNTSIEGNCHTCQVSGGTTAGDNLFHSFEQFNIPAEGSVHFVDPGVANIFSRVTGNSASHINGTLGVLAGDANLFLLNPHGIIFGEGAALDLNGSFLATTADEIQFGDRSFSALPTSQEDLTLLNIDPSALFFNQMGQNQPISITDGAILSVPDQKTITLLGAARDVDVPGVDLTFGGVVVPEGNINIGAIKSTGKVNLDSNLQLQFADDVAQGDISLSQSSGIDGFNISVTGNKIYLQGRSNLFSSTSDDGEVGSINVSANNLALAGGSTISTRSLGAGTSADIKIEVEDSLNLNGLGVKGWQQLLRLSLSNTLSSLEFDTSINAIANGAGKSGNIAIKSKNLNLQGGAWIIATTTNQGNGSNLNLNVSDQILIDNSALFTTTDFSSSGDAGDLAIDTQDLLLQNNSVISSSTLGSGNGGNLTLDVANKIHLRQDLDIPNEIVPMGIFSNSLFGNGAAGNIVLNTSKLVIENGGELSSSSGSLGNGEQGFISTGGDGGNITINATDSIKINGISSNSQFLSGIINSTLSDRPAGNVVINTGKLELQQEAIISASSFGKGAGGDLTINADESISLKGTGIENLEQSISEGIGGELELVNLTGGLLTNTQAGRGGNTQITTPNLTLANGALISTSTVGDGNGGNLEVQTKNLQISSSALVSSATGKGHAGNITIETEQLISKDNGFLSTSSTNLGNAGNLIVDAAQSIRLLGSDKSRILPNGFITSSAGLSYSGNIEVNTPELIIRDGATIDATTGIQNPLIRDLVRNTPTPPSMIEAQTIRQVIINAESIDIAGSAFENVFSSINSSTLSPFPASNVQINTANLSIADQGNISVSSLNQGRAGNLAIVADNLTLGNEGSLNATTGSGQGGNILLDVHNLVTLNHEAAMKTDASGIGNGGNIKIDTTFMVVSSNSGIFARAEAGQGGNIDISARRLLITPDSSISASATAALGIDGEVNIETFETNDRYSLVKLPETPLQADQQVVQACGGKGNKQGVFAYTGRGGLPANLFEDNHLSTDVAIADWGEAAQITPPKEVSLGNLLKFLPNSSRSTVVEAAAWQINRQGKIELVSQSQSDVAKMFSTPSCFRG